uniref:Uncharacterized protein n=1 Tax=Arundo donax TaxID=35708 RepID=A0A0A9E7D2_ARUDO
MIHVPVYPHFTEMSRNITCCGCIIYRALQVSICYKTSLLFS